MKRIIEIIILIILITFLVPIVLTQKFKAKETVAIENEVENVEQNMDNTETNPYTYSKYGTIKLLHHESGEVEELGMDEYLLGVVSAEMPASFEQEALKAQAVVARTYTVYTIEHSNSKHEGADICDDYKCCQAWISKEDRLNKWEEASRESNWAKIEEAVNSTKGKL